MRAVGTTERGEAKLPTNLIEFVCKTPHEVLDESMVTVHEDRWAYCASGGRGDHTWEAIPPTVLSDVRRQIGLTAPTS